MTFGAYRTVKSFVNNCYGSVIIEPVCRDQAPAGFQCITKGRLDARCFRRCVDHTGSSRRVSGPRWNESPAHGRDLTERFLGMLADYRDRLGRGDVVTGSPVGFVGDGSIEIFLDNLFPPRKFIAPAHREIMADLDERFTFG